MVLEGILEQVRGAATRRILFLPHAVRQMARIERMITPGEIRTVIMQGDLIEDDPEDARGHSCLLHGVGLDERNIHVVCAPKGEFVAVITAYLPTEEEWEQDLQTRRSN